MPHPTLERREGEATTRKSRSRQTDGHCLADLPLLARGSLYLGLVMALGGPSCLLTQNPQFDGPQAVGPFINVIAPVQDSVLAVGVVSSSPLSYRTVDVKFDVYSEDLNQPLYAALYLDAATELRDRVGAVARIPAGHLAGGDDGGLAQARPSVTITIAIKPTTTRGCHVLTLFVTHDVDILIAPDLGDPHESWIVDLDDRDPPNLLSNCPQVTR
jgi:hypothetical protein